MSTDEMEEAARRVLEFARAALSPQRLGHSLRVAHLSRELCPRFGVEPGRGYLAGIAHDMMKASGDARLLEFASRDGEPISALEREKPSLLHGRAAAVLLAEEFGVEDFSVLEAVRHHTFGAPGLDSLGKIVFVADKMEPGRESVPAELRSRVLSSGLDEMARLVLEDNLSYLESRGKAISPLTRAMLAETTNTGVRP